MNIEIAKVAQKPDFISTLKMMEVGKTIVLQNMGVSIASLRNAAWRLQKSDDMLFSVHTDYQHDTIIVIRKK